MQQLHVISIKYLILLMLNKTILENHQSTNPPSYLPIYHNKGLHRRQNPKFEYKTTTCQNNPFS
jgi:hypothetical protein